MRGISGGGEKGQKGERTGPPCYRCIRAKPYSLPFPLPFPPSPFPVAIPFPLSVRISSGNSPLHRIVSGPHAIGPPRNGAAVILHLQDPMVVHI